MRRSWRITAACALILAAASILFSAYLFTRVQDERTKTIVGACQRDSAQSEAIIQFLVELGSRPSTVRKARAFFPVLSPEQCEERGQRLVGPPPVKR